MSGSRYRGAWPAACGRSPNAARPMGLDASALHMKAFGTTTPRMTGALCSATAKPHRSKNGCAVRLTSDVRTVIDCAAAAACRCSMSSVPTPCLPLGRHEEVVDVAVGLDVRVGNDRPILLDDERLNHLHPLCPEHLIGILRSPRLKLFGGVVPARQAVDRAVEDGVQRAFLTDPEWADVHGGWRSTLDVTCWLTAPPQFKATISNAAGRME